MILMKINRIILKHARGESSGVFKETNSGCIFYNQMINGRVRLRRYQIKYAREYNEPLHLTINLTNKRNILCLNFNTVMAAERRRL